ncbi:MAG: NfeD family protein [Clostridia bacterium]|nr:NfeD family protein [Clostridia bacterium]
MYGILWIAAVIGFLVLEAATYQFICIWFAGGALGALAAYGLGGSLNSQIAVFFIVSAILLVLTRPFVKKVTDSRKVKTNIESIPGKLARVTETIDNVSETGKIKLEGMEWTARSINNSIITENSTVEVVEVSGVKLLVKEYLDER